MLVDFRENKNKDTKIAFILYKSKLQKKNPYFRNISYLFQLICINFVRLL